MSPRSKEEIERLNAINRAPKVEAERKRLRLSMKRDKAAKEVEQRWRELLKNAERELEAAAEREKTYPQRMVALGGDFEAGRALMEERQVNLHHLNALKRYVTQLRERT